MRLIEQRDPEVPVDAACHALRVSRASLYRSWRPPAPPSSPVTRERAPSPRRLDDVEPALFEFPILCVHDDVAVSFDAGYMMNVDIEIVMHLLAPDRFQKEPFFP